MRASGYEKKLPLRTVVMFPALAVFFLFSCRSHQNQGAPLSEEEALREKIAALSRQEQVLNSNISLARTPAPYLSIDAANRKVDLMIRGRSLRTFPIARITRTGGDPAVAQIWMETEARPFQPAARARMVPGSGEATTSSLAAQVPWGPQRMPADYDLICKGDQAIEVRSLPAQSRNRFVRWIVGGYRRTSDWARDILGRRGGNFHESIEVWMSEDDARLLFWSLPKQFGILLLNVP